MAEFFGDCGPHRLGLAVLLTAGTRPDSVTAELAVVLEEAGVNCLELMVPFPDSVTDGPVLRRSAARALARGTGLDETLSLVVRLRPALRRTQIVVLADWRHTVHPIGEQGFARRVVAAGADGVLVHGTPPKRAPAVAEAAAAAHLATVGACYVSSRAGTATATAASATGYVYLVAHYGRSGTAMPFAGTDVRAALDRVRAVTSLPVAVGFGVREAADVARVAATGADAAVVGTAAAEVLDRADVDGYDPAERLDQFVRPLISSARG